jgi:hypothetical protein
MALRICGRSLGSHDVSDNGVVIRSVVALRLHCAVENPEPGSERRAIQENVGKTGDTRPKISG